MKRSTTQIDSGSKEFQYFWMSKKQFGFILLVMAFAGCQNRSKRGLTVVPPSPSPETTTAKPNQKSSSISEFKATIIAEDLPNQYVVRLSWKVEGESNLKITRAQKMGEKNVSVVQILKQSDTEAQDKMVEPGAQYEYFIEQLSTGQMNSLGLSVPKDFEVRGDVYNPSLTGYHRVFLQRGSQIFTEGKPLRIEAAQLYSDGASITSFLRNATAVESFNGRSGGNIEIVAESAHGRLVIFGNGENGGVGSSGIDGVTGKTGEKGQPGNWGMNPELYLPRMNISHNFLESVRVAMARENPPPDSPRWNDTIANVRNFVCLTQPTVGTPGENGTDGRDGATGGRGGDGAEVYVQIKNDVGFNVSVEAEPGIGGLGGRGGRAGKGGMGGEPGDLDRGHLCNLAKQGPAGLNGRDGLQGRVGGNGIRRPVCFSTANRKEGDCNGK